MGLRKKPLRLPEPPANPLSSLLGRLKISHKLLLGGALAALSSLVLFSLYWQQTHQQIRRASLQVEGMMYARKLSRAMTELAQHRGLTSAFRAGDTSLEGRVSDKLGDVDKVFAQLDQLSRVLGKKLGLDDDWKKIAQQWHTLENAIGQTAEDDFSHHSDLIDNMQKFLERLGDRAGLFSDQNIVNTHTARLLLEDFPVLSETLGKLRGRTSALAISNHLSKNQQINQIADRHTASTVLDKINRSIQVIQPTDAAANKQLKGLTQQLNEQTSHFFTLVDSIPELRAGKTASKEVFSAGTQTIATAAKLREILGTFLQQRLEHRANTLKLHTFAILALMLLLLSIGWGVSTLTNRSLIRRIKLMQDIFSRIADGDYSTRFTIDGTDELHALMGSLKKMQTRLETSITEERKQAVEMKRITTALDNVSRPVLLTDATGTIIYTNQAFKTSLGPLNQQIATKIPGFDATRLVGTRLDDFGIAELTTQALAATPPGAEKEFRLAHLVFHYVANPVHSPQGEKIGTVMEWSDYTAEARVREELRELIQEARDGNLKYRIELSDKTGFYQFIGEGINNLVAVCDQFITETRQSICAMAAGDLSQTIEGDYAGAFRDLKDAVNRSINQLRNVITRIVEASNAVQQDAQRIASGNNDLKSRTEQQASSLEQAAASLEEITGTVKSNAANVHTANQLSSETQKKAKLSDETVRKTISAMNAIQESSNKIANIIGVIDEIAFQTNLLALNAAVEAAHAGDQGKGFAVVASEVRNLAQRSSEAARQIKDLINDSEEKVEFGTQLVNESGEILSEIINSICRVNKQISEIASAGEEQAVGIEMVNQSINTIDHVNQQNSQLVKQTADASAHLSKQAQTLAREVSYFRLEADTKPRLVPTQAA